MVEEDRKQRYELTMVKNMEGVDEWVIRAQHGHSIRGVSAESLEMRELTSATIPGERLFIKRHSAR